MPNRILKESIRTSKTVNAMTDFQFRVWVYLITYVDDYGRGSADPELVKGFVFPRRKRVSESDIEKTLAELAGMGCISLYDVDGESYFCFPNWGDHQRIQNKKSKYPEPNQGNLRESTVSYRDSPPESKSESKSEAENDARARAPIAAVMEAYRNKVNPQLSERGRDELTGFVEVMGAEVCLRAIDIALDAKKATWPYIRAILHSKQSQGVRCLADWDALEEKHGKRTPKGGGNPFLNMLEGQK